MVAADIGNSNYRAIERTKISAGKILYAASVFTGCVFLVTTSVFCMIRSKPAYGFIADNVFNKVEEGDHNEDYKACEVYVNSGVKERSWIGSISAKRQYGASGPYDQFLMETCRIDFAFDKGFIDKFNKCHMRRLRYDYGKFEIFHARLKCYRSIIDIADPTQEANRVYIAKFIDAVYSCIGDDGRLSDAECEIVADKMFVALKSSSFGILCQHGTEILSSLYTCHDFKILLEICNYKYVNIKHFATTLHERNMLLDDITIGLVKGGVKTNKSHMKTFLQLLNDRGLNDEQAARLLEWYIDKTHGVESSMNLDVINAFYVYDTTQITIFGQKLVALQIMIAIKENLSLYNQRDSVINVFQAVIVNQYARLRRELMKLIM